jgi:hypothetical protein
MNKLFNKIEIFISNISIEISLQECIQQKSTYFEVIDSLFFRTNIHIYIYYKAKFCEK